MDSTQEAKLLKIHNAIHNGVNEVEIDGEKYAIKNHPTNLCRCVSFEGVQYMEQNAFKTSKYAQLARDGHKITWGIRPSKWILIMDGKIT